MIEHLNLDFDMRTVLHELSSVGAVSIPMMNETLRRTLQPVVLDNQVRQEFFACDDLRPNSGFRTLARTFQIVLESKLEALSSHDYPFERPFELNDMVLQRYQPGPVGISPHVDGRSMINLVCIFVLEGEARFCICRARDGCCAVSIDNEPGRVVLLRASGFYGCYRGPFHFVSDITSQRTVFSLRQRRPGAKAWY